jgi:RimJ/RimL family protein N-acetyltransferase
MNRIVLPAEPLVDGPTALRPWRDSDLRQLVSICQDPEIARWTRVPERFGEADGRAYLLSRYDAIFSGVTAPFAVVDAHDQTRVLGSTSLFAINWEHLRGEVGYWLGRAARGQGHVTRALGLICRFGFESLGLERIELYAGMENPASQRVAERTGFVREAVVRSFLQGKGERQDVVAFGLLRGER